MHFLPPSPPANHSKEPKKITFLTQYYLPEIGAPPVRISETAKGLVKRGQIVRVISAVPNRPEGRIHDGFRDKFVYKSFEDGITVTRVALFIPKLLGDFFNRLVSEASFALSVLIFASRDLRRSDVIVIQNPPLFSALLSPVLKAITKAKIINWCSDVWPDLHIELGTLHKGDIVPNIMKLIQKTSLYFSDAVAVTTTKTIVQIGSVYGVEKTLLWPNAVDTNFFSPQLERIEFRKKWAVDTDDFLVGYAGLHGNFQNLHVVLDAAKLIEGDRVRFVLIGNGPQKQELKERLFRENIKNVIMADSELRSNMPSVLQSFDVLLIPLARAMPTTIPSKFYECISSGKAVIVVDGSEITSTVEEHALGAVYKCNDAYSLAGVVSKLSMIDSDLLAGMGERARELAFEFDREKVINKIQLDLNTLLECSPKKEPDVMRVGDA